MIHKIKEQLAKELNCNATDFDCSQNIVTDYKLHAKRRRYIEDDRFLSMACLGNATVAMVQPEIKTFMQEYLKPMVGFRCFDQPLYHLEEELKKYDAYICEMEQFSLRKDTSISLIQPEFDVEILVDDEITKLYSDHRFHMALGYTQEEIRRDVIAVVAYHNGTILGVAGASNDTDELWQIGIDVVNEYRNQHIATALVTLISNEILKRGKIPFYGYAWSNIASQRVAIASGFYPSWVELCAKKSH